MIYKLYFNLLIYTMYDLEEKEKETKFGKIIKVSGPLVVAENMAGAKMYELVKIGWS